MAGSLPSVTIGFQGEHIQMNGNGTFQLNPLATFTSAGGYSGNNVADFVAGMPDGMAQGNGQLSRDGQNLPSLYFQDNWKMKKTFQLNYGLRWDPYFPSHNKYGQAANFTSAGYNAGNVDSKFVNAPPGITFPGDPGSNGKSDTLNHALDFSPRIGIVWDPRGKGRETVRAGYGIFYDTSLMWNAMHVVLNAPWGNTVSFTPLTPLFGSTVASSGGGEANPYFGQPGGNTSRLRLTRHPAGPSQSTEDSSSRTRTSSLRTHSSGICRSRSRSAPIGWFRCLTLAARPRISGWGTT